MRSHAARLVAVSTLLLAVRRQRPRAAGRDEGRMALLRRRFGQHQVLAARPDQREQRQGARDRLAVEGRQLRPDPRLQLGSDAADDRRRALLHRRLAARRRRRRCGHRRDAVDVPPRRRRARRSALRESRIAGSPTGPTARPTPGSCSITPGYQLVALDAKTGRPIPTFGKDGIVELTEGLDRDVVKPGQIGSSSPAIVVRDVVVVGAAMIAGTAPPSKAHVPGYIRGFDVRTGKRIWTFKTIPQPGEFGHETWEDGSWKYTGNTGAWAPLAADEELGYVYVPVEAPTGDFYGGHRLGDNLFSDSLVCLDAKTGKRVWHFQTGPPRHLGLGTVVAADPRRHHRRRQDDQGRRAGHQAGVHLRLRPRHRQAGMADRGAAGAADRRARRADVADAALPDQARAVRSPGRHARRSDRLHARAEGRGDRGSSATTRRPPTRILPPIVPGTDGKLASLWLPHHTGGANWPGGALDPETGIMYVSSVTNADARGGAEGRSEAHRHGLRRPRWARIPARPAAPCRPRRRPIAGESAGTSQLRAAGSAADPAAVGPHHRDRPRTPAITSG